MRLHSHLPILPTLLLLLLLIYLTTPISAQSWLQFSYRLPNSKCRNRPPPGSGRSDALATNGGYQCIPVSNALHGSFDVLISGILSGYNTVPPSIMACMTADCDVAHCCRFSRLVSSSRFATWEWLFANLVGGSRGICPG